MTLKQAIKDLSWLLERMSNQKVEGNDGPGFRHVNCPKMLWEELAAFVDRAVKEGEGRETMDLEIKFAQSLCVNREPHDWEQCEHCHYLTDSLVERETARLKRATQPPQELEGLREALEKLKSYNEDILAGRINYRPEDHIAVARAALTRGAVGATPNDWSPGDVIAAGHDGTIVLDDGITTFNKIRAKDFIAGIRAGRASQESK